MFNRSNRNDVDDGVQDIQNDVNQLADNLGSILKSRGSDAKGEIETVRSKAQVLLKETRARMHGRTRAQQAVRDAVGCADSFVCERPWCSVDTAAAVGIFIGALLNMCKSQCNNDSKCASLTPKSGFGASFCLVSHKNPPTPSRSYLG